MTPWTALSLRDRQHVLVSAREGLYASVAGKQQLRTWMNEARGVRPADRLAVDTDLIRLVERLARTAEGYYTDGGAASGNALDSTLSAIQFIQIMVLLGVTVAMLRTFRHRR